ncbi:hypothetical protein Tco_0749727 [Tanacetum coccineum]|uniref:Uncharacterized protein n=1 Tax=Tanacetum coccineum TaxID=301880 RepID=A0ABQ4Z0J5_9ASTR
MSMMHFLKLEVVEKLLELEMLLDIKALEMEALVDAMDVDSAFVALVEQSGLSSKRDFIVLFKSRRHMEVLVVDDLRLKRPFETFDGTSTTPVPIHEVDDVTGLEVQCNGPSVSLKKTQGCKVPFVVKNGLTN